MCKFLKNIVLCCAFTIFWILIIFFSIVLVPSGSFSNSYMAALKVKYNYLVNTNEPKIIIIGGSNLVFSLDSKKIEDEFGCPVVNLGLHAGVGARYETELAKANINEGDIVLLGYEYDAFIGDGFKYAGIDSIMECIDDNLEMYRYLPIEYYPDVIGYMFTYAGIKNKHLNNESGVYSIEAFDEKGNYVFSIDEILVDSNPQSKIDLNRLEFTDYTVEYLSDFREYVISRGASIYWISPSLYDNAVIGDYTKLDEFKIKAEKLTGIKYICLPQDYVFEQKYMYDTKYHCNYEGKKYRTEMLIEDMKEAGIIN